jgi:SAM-dependent methyltransferase
MDERTNSYYATHSDEIVQRYEAIQAPLKRMMERGFDRGMRVLDVGAGSGRDLSLLLQMGCDAYGVEPCDALRSAAIRRHPELFARIGASALPTLGQPFGGHFDAVLCSAVLMHLTRAEMLDAAISLRTVLKDGGKLLLSVPGERPGVDDNHRDSQGRLFTPIDPDYLQLLYERIGFFLLQRWESEDALGRAGHSWKTFLFEARYPGGSRPLDQIEAILNRDRKTATYKLALFRALSEIATMEFDHEASRIAGRSRLSEESWQNDLFLSVYNAVEFTAAQRGLERWHP